MRSKLLLALTFVSAIVLVLLHAAALAATLKPWTGNYPLSGSVTIPAGEAVVLDTDVALANLTIEGQLVCADKNVSLRANWIMVHGLLRCGTAAAPFTKQFDITLTGSNTTQDVMGMGTKFLGAMGGGRIELHGEPRKGWTRLATTAKKGALKITLKEAPPWRVGDRIVIVSTDYRAEHAEERRIAAISGNVVTLGSRLDYEHWCASSTYGGTKLEECAEVGLLSRNIVIRGNASSTTAGFGGHVMIMNGSSARLSGVQFLHMGQKAKLGRYPMHWHLVGDAPGQYVKESSFVHSYNRFVSIHGTHQVKLSGNVGFDTIGHGYYLEDGIEHGNVIENNLGADVKSSDAGPTPSDKRASVFWISNPDNTIRGNVAAGGEHVGFWLGFPEHPVGLSTDPSIWPQRTPLRLFDSNVSHSNYAYGLFVDGGENPDRTFGSTWYQPRQNPADPDSPVVPPVFSNFTTYKNRYEAIWLRSFSKPVLRSVKVADSWVGAYFASRSEGAGTVESSLFVGETGNPGNPSVWETRALDGRELVHFWAPGDSVRGLEYYDGPMTTKDTVFANFVSNSQRKAGGITNLSGNPFAVSSMNTLSTASFVNANKVWLDPLTDGNDGDAFSVVRDLDGSVTGVANRSIVPKNPLLYTGNCTSKPNWNAYICPYRYVSLKIQSNGVDLRGTTIKRNDGATYSLTGVASNHSTQAMVLIEDRQYSVSLPVAIPKTLTFLRWENPGKAARVSLKYPYSSFSVVFENHPVAKASSLSELSTGGSKYFYDAATQRLHLRVVSTNGAPQSYHVIHK